MRNTIMILSVLVTSFGAAALVSAEPKKLFLDVHDVGPGKVTAKDVAGAHQKDLATEKKYGDRVRLVTSNGPESPNVGSYLGAHSERAPTRP